MHFFILACSFMACGAQGRRVCLIWLPVCRSDSSFAVVDAWKDEDVWAYRHLGVGEIANSCLARAQAWHHFCRNSDAEPVQAMFAPTEQTSVYPPPTREQETCPHGQKYSSGQDFAQAPALAHRTKRVALVITGQVFRFTFNTTAMHVVRPNIEAGHSVHVFVYLSRDDCRGSHNSNVWAHAHMSDPLSDDGEQQLADAFKTEVEKHGGTLAVFEVGNHWSILEDIGAYRFSQWKGDKCARLQQYVGWHRAWQRVQELELAARSFFDVLILHRSDGFWVHAMAPVHSFPPDALSARGCNEFGGVNDKVFVIPRALAPLWLQVIVHVYIDLGALPAWFNAEQMLQQFAASKRIPLSRRDPAEMPVLDFRNFSVAFAGPGAPPLQVGGCFVQAYADQCVPAHAKEYVAHHLCP